MNSIITEMKSRVEEGINSRKTKAEEQISDLEDRMVKITTIEQNKEKRMKKNENGLSNLQYIKCTNMWDTGIPEEEKEKGSEKISGELIVENLLKWEGK